MTDEHHSSAPLPDARAPEVDEGYAPDDLPVLKIGLWITGLAVVFLVAVVALYQFFVFHAQELVAERQLRPLAPETVQARDRDAALLGKYDEVEGQAGHYRIPISRAMELLAADPELLKPRGGK